MTDSTFAFVIEKNTQNSIKIRGYVSQAGGAQALTDWDKLIVTYQDFKEVVDFYHSLGLDTAHMKELHSEPIAATALLVSQNPNFAGMSQKDRLLVLNNLEDSLSSPTFIASNPSNIVASKITYSLANDPNSASRNISMGEAASCVFAAIGGQIVSGWSTLQQLVNVINGTNLGWSGIKAVAGSALSTIAGSNVVGMAVNFGICMALAYIF